MSKLSRFAELAKLFAPLVLTSINPALGPIASTIAHGISVAEEMPGASGAAKLESVKQLASDTVTAVNQAAGKTLVDPVGLNQAVTDGVNTTVAVLNLIAKSPTVSVTVPTVG